MRVDRTVCALPVRRGQLRRSGCSISVIAGHQSKLLSRRDVSRKSSVRVLVASTLEAPETENRRKTTSENVIVTETRVRIPRCGTQTPAHGSSPRAGECLKLGAFGISLPQYFRWAAAFYHAESTSMRVGAKCFWLLQALLFFSPTISARCEEGPNRSPPGR